MIPQSDLLGTLTSPVAHAKHAEQGRSLEPRLDDDARIGLAHGAIASQAESAPR